MKLKRDHWRSGIFSVSIRNPPKKSRSSDEPSQVEKVATLLLMQSGTPAKKNESVFIRTCFNDFERKISLSSFGALA